ncbi:uncharacterized protein LOC21406015 isoform X1 [Morus notabilis]|uniref:uncharacterized protein LOC21406015 isoform X1 n=1 Tax=Morus notabilis TaxID=981085 RepID=UPI000CECEB9C|nr:uncharacterized protein LOC21406015 isoform X1 [Morus notabilis]
MEAQEISQQPSSSATVQGNKSSRLKAFCKCSVGWSCVITRTEGPDAGKAFVKCGGECTCVIEADGTVIKDAKLPKELEDMAEGEVFCKCGEGWSCVISKVEGPDAAKSFYEC